MGSCRTLRTLAATNRKGIAGRAGFKLESSKMAHYTPSKRVQQLRERARRRKLFWAQTVGISVVVFVIVAHIMLVLFVWPKVKASKGIFRIVVGQEQRE